MNIYKFRSIEDYLANRNDEWKEKIGSIIVLAMIFGLAYLALIVL